MLCRKHAKGMERQVTGWRRCSESSIVWWEIRTRGPPWWLSAEEPTCQRRGHGASPGLGDPTCLGAPEPVHHSHQALRPGAHASQRESGPTQPGIIIMIKNLHPHRTPEEQPGDSKPNLKIWTDFTKDIWGKNVWKCTVCISLLRWTTIVTEKEFEIFCFVTSYFSIQWIWG